MSDVSDTSDMVKCPECNNVVGNFEEHLILNNGRKKVDYKEIRAAVCPECEALWHVLETTQQ